MRPPPAMRPWSQPSPRAGRLRSRRCRRSSDPTETVACRAARLQSSMRSAQREPVLSPAANPSGSGVYVAVKWGKWLTRKARRLRCYVALSIADVAASSLNSQTASAAANKSHDASENYCSHPTLITGVHFGLDDGDGFFNSASCAFAALRLSACSLPSIDGDGFFNPASCAFAALRLSACSLASIEDAGFFSPASSAFAALRLSACSLPSIDADGFFNPASCDFAALRFSAYSLPSIGATCGG